MPELRTVIADNIRAERVRRRLKPTALQDALGLGRSAVWDIENAQRDLLLREILIIARALDCTLADLVRGADPEDLSTLGYG